MDSLFEIKNFIRVNQADSNKIQKYIVIFDIKNSLYTVLCSNFYYYTTSIEEYFSLEKQTIELLIDIPPEERDEWYKTLDDAIRAHDEYFKETGDNTPEN